MVKKIICMLALTCTISACTKPNIDAVEITTTAQIESTPAIYLLSQNNRVNVGGVLLCDLAYLAEDTLSLSINKEMIQLPEGFTADITVMQGTNGSNNFNDRYMLSLSNVQAVAGEYIIKLIVDSNVVDIPVIVEDVDISLGISITCGCSDTTIADGESISIDYNYTGVAVECAEVTYCFDKDKLIFDNCVGDISVKENLLGGNICLNITNMHILDKSIGASITLPEGSAIDANGAKAHAVRVELKS